MFYEKMKVPPPTFCPDCRLQRRMAHYNTFVLYKRPCDLCKKEVVSRYSPDKNYKIYCPRCWWSDKWNPFDYGRDYDFSRPFFEQFADLWKKVPLLGLSLDLPSALESPYNNNSGHLKQCYLLFEGDQNERCLYGHYVIYSKDCVESSFIKSCELSYDLFHALQDFKLIYSQHTGFSRDSAFLWQCANCQNCFMSANLRHKQYYILNKPYSREEYFKEITEFDLGSYQNYTRLKEEAKKHWLKYPVKTFWHEFSKDTSGLFVFQSKNCQHCFEVYGAEDCKFVSYIETAPVKDSYDCTGWGNAIELVYEAITIGENVRNLKFGLEAGLGLYDAEYVVLGVNGASNLFGSIGIKSSSYCILNKQYSKESFVELKAKIIKHMDEMPYVDKSGVVYKYGEFFPIEISPFAYNETLAQRYYPYDQNQALEKGYAWKEPEAGQHKVTILAKDLPDHIKDVTDSILQESIGCLSCGKAFRLVPQELEFYRKINVPLPKNCFYCRLDEKMKDQPHPLQLYKRKCQCTSVGSENGEYQNSAGHFHGSNPCPNEFETCYSSDKPEIVYCEECYQAEVV